MIWRTPYLTAMFQKYLSKKTKSIEYINNANLKEFCTFRIGGCAKHLFIIHDTDTLLIVCYICKVLNIKFKIIGLGANILFDDAGYNGVIIVNKSDKILIKDNYIYADSGVLVSSIIAKCKQHQLNGLEALAGIPSTLGGAMINNLGAFNVSISELTVWVECFDINALEIKIRLKNIDCKFNYRDSIFKDGNYIITRIKLQLKHGTNKEINNNIKEAITKKTTTQPLDYPSAGSIFKRCEIIPAKVIDELGLKETRFGNAEISKKHAGFIINTNNATSRDVLKLINFIKQKVINATNVDLKEEIEYVKP